MGQPNIEEFAAEFEKQNGEYQEKMTENPQDYHNLTIKQVKADADLAKKFGFSSTKEAMDALIVHLEAQLV